MNSYKSTVQKNVHAWKSLLSWMTAGSLRWRSFISFPSREPWNDDWSDPVQLSQYIKEAFAAYFFKRTTTSLRILQQLRSGMLFKHQKGPLLVIVRPGVSAHNEAINQRKKEQNSYLIYTVCFP